MNTINNIKVLGDLNTIMRNVDSVELKTKIGTIIGRDRENLNSYNWYDIRQLENWIFCEVIKQVNDIINDYNQK